MQSKGSSLLLLGTLHSNRVSNDNTNKIKKKFFFKTLPFKSFLFPPNSAAKRPTRYYRDCSLSSTLASKHFVCASYSSLRTAGVWGSWPGLFRQAAVSLTSTEQTGPWKPFSGNFSHLCFLNTLHGISKTYQGAAAPGRETPSFHNPVRNLEKKQRIHKPLWPYVYLMKCLNDPSSNCKRVGQITNLISFEISAKDFWTRHLRGRVGG